MESVAGDVIKICNGLKELNECIERNVECWQLKHQTQCNCLQYLKATCWSEPGARVKLKTENNRVVWCILIIVLCEWVLFIQWERSTWWYQSSIIRNKQTNQVTHHHSVLTWPYWNANMCWAWIVMTIKVSTYKQKRSVSVVDIRKYIFLQSLLESQHCKMFQWCWSSTNSLLSSVSDNVSQLSVYCSVSPPLLTWWITRGL